MISLILGYAGTVTSIVSMQLKRQKHILLSQAIANGFGAFSYLFLGGDSRMAGTGMVLGAVQCLVNYGCVKNGKPTPRFLPGLFLLLSVLNSVLHISASGVFRFPVDLISAGCALLFVIGVTVKKATGTRLFFLANASLWIVYDLLARPITQGACASRPGNTYEGMISRALGTDYINLGFTGSAKAEEEMARYISALDMSAFVYDYDHNAPTLGHLEATHGKMFRTIRERNPDLPILILTRPVYRPSEEEKQRLAVVRKTYEEAVAAGDRNTCFIEGSALMRYARNDGTADGCHPNDLGFYSMAKCMIRQLKTLL